MKLLRRAFILFLSRILLSRAATTKIFQTIPIYPSSRRFPHTPSLLLKLRGGSDSSSSNSKKKKSKQKQAVKKQTGKNKKPDVGGGKSGDCFRRIKREWKDAVKLGVGYDWQNQKTVTRKRSLSSSFDQSDGSDEDNENNFYKYNDVRIGPLGKNILRWHFSVMGPSDSEYDGGVYHGMVILPKDYPLSPPRVQVLTPSGRFIPGEDICLSASAYHPEAWTPRWTIFSLIEALRLHMLTAANEIGGVNASREKRIRLAKASRVWSCGIVNHESMISDEKLFTTKNSTATENDATETIPSPNIVKSDCLDIIENEENESGEKSEKSHDGSNSDRECVTTFRTRLDETQMDQIRQLSKSEVRLDERQQERESTTLVIFKELFILIFQRHLKVTLALFGTWYMLKYLINF